MFVYPLENHEIIYISRYLLRIWRSHSQWFIGHQLTSTNPNYGLLAYFIWCQVSSITSFIANPLDLIDCDSYYEVKSLHQMAKMCSRRWFWAINWSPTVYNGLLVDYIPTFKTSGPRNVYRTYAGYTSNKPYQIFCPRIQFFHFKMWITQKISILVRNKPQESISRAKKTLVTPMTCTYWKAKFFVIFAIAQKRAWPKIMVRMLRWGVVFFWF